MLKAIYGLRSEATRTYLSYAWWILDPVLHMAVLYLVFGILLQSKPVEFIPFLLCGVASWQWASKTIMNCLGSISNNSSLMMKISVPKIIFPLVTLVQDSVKHCVALVALICLLILSGSYPAISWLSFPLILFIQFMVNAIFSILVAALAPFFPDLRLIVQVMLQIIMYCSGIFYDISDVSSKFQSILMLNPFAFIIVQYRQILMHGAWPDWSGLFMVFLSSTIMLYAVSALVFRYDRIYPRLSLQ